MEFLHNIEKQAYGFFEADALILPFGKQAKVYFEQAVFPYVEQTVKYINHLPASMLERLSTYSLRYAIDFCETIGEDFESLLTEDFSEPVTTLTFEDIELVLKRHQNYFGREIPAIMDYLRLQHQTHKFPSIALLIDSAISYIIQLYGKEKSPFFIILPHLMEDFEQNPTHILHYISPIAISLSKWDETDEIGVQIEFECAWEPEHGMEWDFRGEQILYVGSFSALGANRPFSDYETEYGNYLIMDSF